MVIKENKYVIATKSFPLRFDDGEGNKVDCIQEACLGSYEDTQTELETFDKPDKFQILNVEVTYEF